MMTFQELATLNSVLFPTGANVSSARRAIVVPKAYVSAAHTTHTRETQYKTQQQQTHDAQDIILTYGQLSAIINQLTTQAPFSLLQPGDVVSFLVPNSLEFVAVFFAITAMRAIAAPLNPNYKPAEAEFFLQDAASRCIVTLKGSSAAETGRIVSKKLQIPLWEVSLSVDCWNSNVNPSLPSATPSLHVKSELVYIPTSHPMGLESLPVRQCLLDGRGADVALFLHTSGTTSRPKGVPLGHTNILTTLENIRQTYSLTPSDTTYLVMPLFHVHGLIGVLLSSLYAGSTIVLPPKFSVTHFWNDFNTWKCTWYSAVPTIHQMLLSTVKQTFPGHCKTLRFIRSCSAALAPATLKALESTFHAPVIEAYAMTEAAHQMTANFLPPGKRKAGSVGKGRGVDVITLTQEDNQVAQVGQVGEVAQVGQVGEVAKGGQVGEVCIRGRNVFSGYHNNPQATASSFVVVNGDTQSPYFRTGDLGYLDQDGFLFLIGRLKEQINRGGEKISPLEIDNILLEHPLVSEAVAFGVKDQLYGEEVYAAVVLKKTAKGANTAGHAEVEEELKRHCRKSLVEFKVPKKMWIVDQIPKGPTGKVQRRIVSQVFAEKVLRSGSTFKSKL